MSLWKPAFLCIGAISGMGIRALCQEWSQWRGPARDGVTHGFQAPQAWPEKLTRVWRVRVGAGLSSPVVADGKIYLLTREGEKEVITCLDWDRGKVLWRNAYASPFYPNAQASNPMLFPASRGMGPFATPAVVGNRVLSLGVDRILSILKADSGDLVWRKHFFPQRLPKKWVYVCPPCRMKCDGREFENAGICPNPKCPLRLNIKGIETSATAGGGNYYGAAASPAIYGNVAVIHVGNAKDSRLIALDPNTGRGKWQWRGPAVASSSPIPARIHGVDQWILLTRDSCEGIAMADGKPLWSLTLPSNAQIVTPVAHGDLVIFAGYRGSVMAFRIEKKETWSARRAWVNAELSLETSSLVGSGPQIFGFFYTNRGQFGCLDAETGKTRWASEGRQGRAAAMVVAGDVLLALKSDGVLMVLENTAAAYKPLARYEVAKTPTWTYPVALGQKILVKEAEALSLWSTAP